MRRAFSFLLTLLTAAFVLIAPAFAVLPDEVLPDPALESRARALSQDLRCMVCQNQSIDDSEAPLARDLRVLVRERLTAGDSDQQVLDFLTARYGDFVLLKPRFAWGTALLWLAPAVLLAIGAARLGFSAYRRRRAYAEVARLSPAEEARVAEILGERG
jgi:cytochrome c-type biogenesis protein CcmH